MSVPTNATTFSAADYKYMARALALARNGLYTTDPNPRVGCVIVNDQRVVGEGWHLRTGREHAEVNALRAAGSLARGATAYITLEPCSHNGRTPPCCDALLAAGVSRVVAAMQDPNPRVSGRGFERLRAAGVSVDIGLLSTEAQALNPGFVARMERHRPWLRVKLAMSLDGRTAMASGESQWITGAPARQDVQRLRARSSAILTGAATVAADDPSLNVRLADLAETPTATAAATRAWLDEPRQPLRVILDPGLSVTPAATTLRLPGQVILFTAPERAADARAAALQAAGAELLTAPLVSGSDRTRLDLGTIVTELARRECNEVHVEAGSRLAGALLAAGVVDELVLYIAPLLLGNAARGLVDIPGVDKLIDAVRLETIDLRPVGQDWRWTARVIHHSTA